MRTTRAARLLMAVAFTGVLAAGCDVHSPTGPGTLANITVTPDVTMAPFGTQQFTAVGTDHDGNPVSFVPEWSVVAGGGAIGSSGMFTAGSVLGVFTRTVMASSGGISGTATVTVIAGPLATIEVTPNPATLQINQAQQFTAVGRDAGGNVVAISPEWDVVNGGGSISSGSGLFTAGTSTGTFNNTVRATSGSISGTATLEVVAGPLASIEVTPNPATLGTGQTQQFTAVGRDASGNVVAITPTWNVVNGGGTINAGSGLFTAGANTGTFNNTVRATSGGISGTATVEVVAGPLASIEVTPNPATLGTGQTQQFTAVGRDASGNVVPITPEWDVVNGGGAINAGSGLFTAGTNTGTFNNTVRATSGGISGTATVEVVAAPLASIEVTPNPATLGIGQTQRFTAVGRDAGGNVVAITPTWSVVNGGGTINAGSGLFTAGQVTGTFNNTVRATSGAISGTATVEVVAAPLASIEVTPNPASVGVGQTQQFTAVGRDADGNVVAISPTWAVVNGGGSINSGSGLFTAGQVTGTFNNTVRATSGGISGTATVEVVGGAAPAPFIDLGTAESHGIIAATEVTCISGGLIDADISIHPGLALTGFGPGECEFTGVANLGDAVAAQAQLDLTDAYNELVGLACDAPIVADLGGTTLLPGVYCSGSSIGVTGALTLDGNGDPDAVFVFQAGSTLTTAGDVVLINGAQAKNVYWQVGSSATLGTASQWQGNILAQTTITLNAAVTLLGRALANDGAVTLDANNVITLP